MPRQPLIIGVSGSSAPQLAWTTLQALHHHPDIETHFVISRGADTTIQLEMGAERADFEALADVALRPRLSRRSHLLGIVCDHPQFPPKESLTRAARDIGKSYCAGEL
jgi:hypothetical protein